MLRTLAPRHAARAPGVCGAPRRRSASPLWALLYAFWSRWSRRASIVSDHGVEGTAREAYGVTPLDRNVVMSLCHSSVASAILRHGICKHDAAESVKFQEGLSTSDNADSVNFGRIDFTGVTRFVCFIEDYLNLFSAKNSVCSVFVGGIWGAFLGPDASRLKCSLRGTPFLHRPCTSDAALYRRKSPVYTALHWMLEARIVEDEATISRDQDACPQSLPVVTAGTLAVEASL